MTSVEPILSQLSVGAPTDGSTGIGAGSMRLPKRNDLGKFAGQWNEQEHEEFLKNTKEFSVVDPAEYS